MKIRHIHTMVSLNEESGIATTVTFTEDCRHDGLIVMSVSTSGSDGAVVFMDQYEAALMVGALKEHFERKADDHQED